MLFRFQRVSTSPLQHPPVPLEDFLDFTALPLVASPAPVVHSSHSALVSANSSSYSLALSGELRLSIPDRIRVEMSDTICVDVHINVAFSIGHVGSEGEPLASRRSEIIFHFYVVP